MANVNIYAVSIIVLFTCLLLVNFKPKKKEHFIGPIVKPLSAVGDFVTNFPVIFGILVDALISFVLNFVDIMLSLVDVIMWIINVPMWAIEGAMFIVTAISDIITILILWLNPMVMVKGIIKLIIFMVKLIFMAIIGLVAGIGRTFGEKLLNSLRNGLWGIPHGPEQHLKHRDGALYGGPRQPRRFARYQYGLNTHHHKHDDTRIHGDGDEFDPDNNLEIYHPMRCYKGIGANNYLNIVAIILCPPLGVFMSYGFKGILKIIVCAALSLLYYFPGLIYAFLITTHLGIGREIDTSDCGGAFGGLVVEGCPKRKTKTDCEEATIPNKADPDGKPLRACIWTPDNGNAPEDEKELQGKCYNVHLRYDDYDKMKTSTLNNSEVVQSRNRFNIKGNTRKENMRYQYLADDYRDHV